MRSQRKACMVMVAILLRSAQYGPDSVGRPTDAHLAHSRGSRQLRLTAEDGSHYHAHARPRSALVSLSSVLRSRMPPMGLLLRRSHRQFDADSRKIGEWIWSSLQIEAKKWPFSLSINLPPQTLYPGHDFQATGVEVPAGAFVISIEIADVAGMKTVGSYRLVARGK